MEKHKLTAKGTVLPLMDLKGKDYLQVAWRLVWLREDHPDWVIKTEFVKLDDSGSICKATVEDAEGNVKGWAHKHEMKKAFYVEKSETGAIGRVLAILGYGTQFEPSLDEGEDVVDTPLELETNNKEVKNEQIPNRSDQGHSKDVTRNMDVKQSTRAINREASKLVNHAPKTKEELKGITQEQLTKLRDWAIKTEQNPEDLSVALKAVTGVDKSIMLNQAQYRAFCEHMGIEP